MGQRNDHQNLWLHIRLVFPFLKFIFKSSRKWWMRTGQQRYYQPRIIISQGHRHSKNSKDRFYGLTEAINGGNEIISFCKIGKCVNKNIQISNPSIHEVNERRLFTQQFHSWEKKSRCQWPWKMPGWMSCNDKTNVLFDSRGIMILRKIITVHILHCKNLCNFNCILFSIGIQWQVVIM